MTSLKPPILKTLHVPLSDLEVELLRWTADRWLDCFASIEEHWGEWDWVRRCLGAAFRRRAAADLVWMWATIDAMPQQVIALGRFIKSIKTASGFEVAPGRAGSWMQYVADVQLSFELPYAMAISEQERELPDGYQYPEIPQPAPPVVIAAVAVARPTISLESRPVRARKAITAAGGGLWE